MESKSGWIFGGVIAFVLLLVVIFDWAAPITRAINNWRHEIQVAHDETDYDTLRSVENTARATIATWEADRMRWFQYHDSENERERNWASGARMRANTGASTFNNFMRANNYVWAAGIPDDLPERLPMDIADTLDEDGRLIPMDDWRFGLLT